MSTIQAEGGAEKEQTGAEAVQAANPDINDDTPYEIGEDETETQQVFQDDLNELYTGMLIQYIIFQRTNH